MRSRRKVFFIIRLINKGILLLLFSFLMAGIISFNKRGVQQTTLKQGDIALTNIFAPFTFSYIDEGKTLRARQISRDQVKDVYDLNFDIKRDVKAKINALFDSIAISSENGEITDTGLSLKTIKTLLAIPAEKKDDVRDKIIQICSFLLENGIIDSQDKEKLTNNSSFSISVHNLKSNVVRKRLVEHIPSIEELNSKINEQILFYFPEGRKLRTAVEEVIKKNLSSNLIFNKEKTEKKRQEAWNSIPRIEKKVKKNQLIIARGEVIAANHLSQIEQINKRGQSSQRFFTFIGLNILILVFVILFRKYVKNLSFVSSSFSVFCLLSFVSLLFILLAKGIIIFSLPFFFIPLAFASMLIAILLNLPTAIFLTISLSFFVGLLSNSLDIAIFSFIGGIVGAYAAEGIKKRAQLVKAGFLVGLINILIILALALLKREELLVIVKNSLWGMSQGLLSAFMVMGLLPLFEHLFKLTTNISLLELSDLNNPLLKRLIMEAPGTYHHSLIVGNLAESASEVIGANSLLARVSSYYHDIGKIEKSEYFSENQKGKNKHDKLTPTMSSLIIINHIKDGVEIARKYNLPRQIIDIIKQHHGTSLIPYFYQRALELNKDGKIKEENFRYAGPKPQTKEAAIVMLADSIEASSRSLDDPTPAHLKVLVQKAINDKFIDHQLDECNLALTDLNKISRSFTYVLTGIFHNRVKYLKTENG